MLQQMGISLPTGTSLQLENVAAVMVTAVFRLRSRGRQWMSRFLRWAMQSLRGGTLLMTPLKGADGQIYGMAQGNVLVGGLVQRKRRKSR
jgi:flagellar P-ring protein precursor FlgI